MVKKWQVLIAALALRYRVTNCDTVGTIRKQPSRRWRAWKRLSCGTLRRFRGAHCPALKAIGVTRLWICRHTTRATTHTCPLTLPGRPEQVAMCRCVPTHTFKPRPSSSGTSYLGRWGRWQAAEGCSAEPAAPPGPLHSGPRAPAGLVALPPGTRHNPLRGHGSEAETAQAQQRPLRLP
jgi:hypothetical protein